MAWIAGTQLAWLALASQSTISFSSGPADARVASAFSRSATCSVGSCEKKVSMMWPRANCGSAFMALRKLSRPSCVCSISIFCMPFSKNTCACDDLVEICMPVALSCANACNPRIMSSARMETLIRLIYNSLNPFAVRSDALCARQLWLAAFQKISLLQRKLAVNFQNLDAAINGVNIHQPNRAGNGFHRFQKLVFRSHNNYAAGMRCQQRLKFFHLHVVELFNRRLHLRRGRIAQNKNHRTAIGPLVTVKLEDLRQVCVRQAARVVGLVHNHSQLPRFTRSGKPG